MDDYKCESCFHIANGCFWSSKSPCIVCIYNDQIEREKETIFLSKYFAVRSPEDMFLSTMDDFASSWQRFIINDQNPFTLYEGETRGELKGYSWITKKDYERMERDFNCRN
jgi:hypothetical protein